jgi:hypothetical protein
MARIPKLKPWQWLLVAIVVIGAAAAIWQAGVKSLDDTVDHARECGYREGTYVDCSYDR